MPNRVLSIPWAVTGLAHMIGASAPRVAIAIAMALGAAWLAAGSVAATAPVVVGASVPSATSISTAGCVAGTSSTELGTVLPGTAAITTADCAVAFGSSNDSSALRVHQTDRAGNGMYLPPRTATPNAAFGVSGRQTTASGTAAHAYDAVRQADGSVVVVGSVANASTDMMVARYTPAGALDPAFSADGIAHLDFGGEADIAYSVALQPDGRIVVAGQATVSASYGTGLARFMPDGSLDTSFSGDGSAYLGVTPYGIREMFDVALQPDGKIVAAGQANGFAIIRVNPDGSMDTTFDGDGVAKPNVSGSTSYARTLLVLADGRIVVAGDSYIDAARNYDYAMVRLTTTGALDTTFDVDGISIASTGPSQDIPQQLMLTQDGKYVVAGSISFGDHGLVRFNANGSVDATFGTSGLTVNTAGGAAGDAHQQRDGKIIVVGQTDSTGDFEIVRYRADGSLDTSFDGDGRASTTVGDGTDSARAIIPTVDGRLLLAGTGTVAGVSRFGLLEYDGIVVEDFAASTADWATGPNAFGACLHTLSAATATWPLAGAGNCTTGLGGNWRAIARTSGAAGSSVAQAASGETAAVARLRFGLRTAAAQPPGLYAAAISFEVVAPAA